MSQRNRGRIHGLKVVFSVSLRERTAKKVLTYKQVRNLRYNNEAFEILIEKGFVFQKYEQWLPSIVQSALRHLPADASLAEIEEHISSMVLELNKEL